MSQRWSCFIRLRKYRYVVRYVVRLYGNVADDLNGEGRGEGEKERGKGRGIRYVVRYVPRLYGDVAEDFRSFSNTHIQASYVVSPVFSKGKERKGKERRGEETFLVKRS